MADTDITQINPVFKYLQGRTTTIIWFFSIVGIILQLAHKLDQTFITFAVLMVGATMGHSFKEDWMAAKTNNDPA